MLEKEIEAYFIWTVARLGGKTYKFKSPTLRGVSDQVACLPNGQTWFVELKAPGGRLSPMQKEFAETMDKLDQRYACLSTMHEVGLWFVMRSKGW